MVETGHAAFSASLALFGLACRTTANGRDVASVRSSFDFGSQLSAPPVCFKMYGHSFHGPILNNSHSCHPFLPSFRFFFWPKNNPTAARLKTSAKAFCTRAPCDPGYCTGREETSEFCGAESSPEIRRRRAGELGVAAHSGRTRGLLKTLLLLSVSSLGLVVFVGRGRVKCRPRDRSGWCAAS